MKLQLIMPPQPILVSDEEIEAGEICLVDVDLGRIGLDTFQAKVSYTDHVSGGFEYFPEVIGNQIKITNIL